MNQSQRERLALVLSRAMQAALTESPERVREVLEETLRELGGGAPSAAPARQPGRRAPLTPAREPMPSYVPPLNEAENRKQLVGFLDVMVMASGIVGRRTADRLGRKVFGDRVHSAERWMLDQGLIQPTEDEALQLTEDGLRYLEKHRDSKFKSYVGFEPEASRRGA
ncbi:MAG TPA: hypothetical protein V6D00_08670 [Pantanalinema sp.]